jgi:hypothetical protein
MFSCKTQFIAVFYLQNLSLVSDIRKKRDDSDSVSVSYDIGHNLGKVNTFIINF